MHRAFFLLKSPLPPTILLHNQMCYRLDLQKRNHTTEKQLSTREMEWHVQGSKVQKLRWDSWISGCGSSAAAGLAPSTGHAFSSCFIKQPMDETALFTLCVLGLQFLRKHVCGHLACIIGGTMRIKVYYYTENILLFFILIPGQGLMPSAHRSQYYNPSFWEKKSSIVRLIMKKTGY